MNIATNNTTQYVLKLTVNNHPGVMSHVCGLFSRRGYNLEGIMVRPIKEQHSKRSLIWLLLNDYQTDDGETGGSNQSDQIIRQTEKLIDVVSIQRQPVKDSIFAITEKFCTAADD